MPLSLFNPFETLHFEDTTCFLTGEALSSPEQNITVFPDWILDRFSLREKKFKMLDQITSFHYDDLKLPCSDSVKIAFDNLETEIKAAFDAGYDAVNVIPDERLFLWMGRFVYGVLYNDIILERSRSKKRPGAKDFTLSPALKKRFSKFHLMLQSLVVPMEFTGVKPWSIGKVRVKYSKDGFNYKDEPTNQNFSLGMNGFGIVACLQDNGSVLEKEKEILEKAGDSVLHPIQFEELAARFLYSNYLLKDRGTTDIKISDDKVEIESHPPSGSTFKPWQDDMFAHVLAGYWEPWGFEKKTIFNFPDSPVSFLENDVDHKFIEPESIQLPF